MTASRNTDSVSSADSRRRSGVRHRGLASALAVGIPVVALVAPPLESQPDSTPLEQVQALVQPAVVYEEITWTGYVYDRHNDGYFTQDPFTVSYQCTGFVVNPDGYIGTAGHCVDYDRTVKNAILSQVVDWAYDNDYYAQTPSKETIATFARHWRIDGQARNGRPDQNVAVAYGVSVSGEPTGKALPARVAGVRSADQGDVALLKIDAKNLTAVPLSDNTDTGVGTEIVSVGYPASVDLVTDVNFNPSFKEGSISAEKTIESGLLPVYEISAAVSGGMSGGPTTELNGEVIGVNSFGISGETQSFNFVQPSQTLQELLRAEGVENNLGEVTDRYRAGLQAYFAGDRDAAIEDFEQVLQVVPTHQLAQEYLQKSQELPESSGITRFLWIGLLIAGLLILIVGVIVLVVLLSRRKKTSAPAGGAVPAQTAPPAAAPTPPEQPATAPASEEPPASEESGEGDAPRFCSNCGKPHDADAHFCPHCGHDLT
ncbi:MAG: trypsin-like peptidase domain-containing protein [Candidatus Nanopelagicales bacterium]